VANPPPTALATFLFVFDVYTLPPSVGASAKHTYFSIGRTCPRDYDFNRDLF